MQALNGDRPTAMAQGSAPASAAIAEKDRAVPPRVLRQARFAQAFSSIVAVLMRDADYRNLKIATLEQLVIPAVLSGQWRIAHAPARSSVAAGDADKASAPMVPVAAALWASVSDDVDNRLTQSLNKQLALKPNEWASGSNVWLIAIAGDRRAAASVLKQLRDKEFKDKTVKLVSRGPDGKSIVQTLDKFAC